MMPEGVALHATRILAAGDLTVEAVHRMEKDVDRAVDELVATGVDVIAYCDMVTTFIMESGWNEAKVADIVRRTGTAAISAWTALRDALSALKVRRFALGTPYPAAIHRLAPRFFAAQGYEVVDHATLDILKMRDVPRVREHASRGLSTGCAARARMPWSCWRRTCRVLPRSPSSSARRPAGPLLEPNDPVARPAGPRQ